MPVSRPSQNAEAARLAAEFNEKKWVWVPDEREGYLAGYVNKEDESVAEVVMASGGDIRHVYIDSLSKMNPPKFDRVEDIADLTFMNEASVVHNLRLRYGSGAIYTYSGLFLVAINPYQSLPLYSDAIIQQYRNKRRDENPPHIFAVAERAWINMGEERENQSILITGESGAGKTESTKKVIQYLAAIATDVHAPGAPNAQSPTPSFSTFSPTISGSNLPRNSSFKAAPASSGSHLKPKDRLGLLERQILQANPILEAFGNAQTQRNNNSSRFGKFIRINFAPDGSIAGANMDWYLLEKSRVIFRNEAERNFHVFYQLLLGGGSLKGPLLLDGGIEDYEYLNKSRREIDGVNDYEEWNTLMNALDVVGFTANEQFDLFRVIAAILHIGNITITATRADDAVMPDPSQAERVCHLLGLPVSEFTRAVLRPRVLAGREWVTQARTRQQAVDELGSLCKTLYEKAFGQLVDRINRALDRPSSKSTFIGVLDIAGFEIFETNAYEQLLINYTNEKLQQFFNHHMFVLEQEEYAREGIEWVYINFGLDLQPTIDLIESSGSVIGILSCLDEECIMPKATDITFTNKLNQMWASEPGHDEQSHPGREKYEPSRFEQGFIVTHYAGRVEYRTDGWLEKNKDPLNDNLTRVMAASTEPYIAGLFADSTASGPKRVIKKGAFRTVAQRHKEQLSSLMNQLHSTQPHFVRCIVPNTMKKPGRIYVPLVLDQLRCNGVLEGIRIARRGYPNRLPFVEFRQRYEVLTPGIIPRGYMDGRKACSRIAVALELHESIYKVGTSKIFFKAGVLAELEERRDALLFDMFARFQAAGRAWSARRQMKKILNRAVAIRTIQRNARVYGELKDWPWWQLYTKVRPLLAATRSDEELRRKELELAMARERAQRDQQEREALQNLKMSLEAEKKKVEEELRSERDVGLEKDALLERSKNREVELEEEIIALQADLDTLDSQLDRAMAIQKDSEEKHEALKQAFDQAAEHLVRLEGEQQDWVARESELVAQIEATDKDLAELQSQRDEFRALSEDLHSTVEQKEQDLARLKERMEFAIGELEGKLETEVASRESFKSRAESLEDDARKAKDQATELTRTANEYSNMILKQEQDIAHLSAERTSDQHKRSQLSKQIHELQARLDASKAEMEAQRSDHLRETELRAKLQEELDELRALMATKTSEESRRNEVEKSKDLELANLRQQNTVAQKDLAEARSIALDLQGKLDVELDAARREYKILERAHHELLAREQATSSQASKAEATVAELEKAKRALESDLQSIRTRQLDTESQLAEALGAKESLERHLTAAQSRYQDFEDTVLQLEREKANHDKQLETARKELADELAKRTHLEHVASTQKAELVGLRDFKVKTKRDLDKALKDLKNKEWECKQLESRQDKTIVEHVHVLEEAKRVTDRQLADAQKELQKNQVYIRSLEKAKSRLAGEAEDLVRETERERVELRAREKSARTQEERASRALVEIERERKARESVEAHNRKLQNELLNSHNLYADLSQQLSLVQQSKDTLEAELARLADETESTSPMAKALFTQSQTNNVHASPVLGPDALEQITILINKHHEELRRLILSDEPRDESFQSRLLQELRLVDEELNASSKRRMSKNGSVPAPQTDPVTPKKRSSRSSGHVPEGQPRTPRPHDKKQINTLKQHVQTLEVRIAASDRVRKHLEELLRAMTTELEKSDSSNLSLVQYRARLEKEKAHLAKLLEQEKEANRSAEAAQIGDIQAMWAEFQTVIDEERENYTRLEEARKALLVQQRATQADLEGGRTQIRELTQTKQKLQAEVLDCKRLLDAERSAKNDALASQRSLQDRLQTLEISAVSQSAIQSAATEALESYKAKAKSYADKLEAAEIAAAKASRAEALVRRSLADAEKMVQDSKTEQDALSKRLQDASKKIRSLEAKLAKEDKESSESILVNQRLAEELADERKQHQKALEERDFNADQIRKKYQTELAGLSQELQSARDSLTRLREDNRKLRSDYDSLQSQFDSEVYNGGAWKKEKERMQTKINDLQNAYESSAAAQTEQQSQIVALHSQIRELRSVLNDAEADRALLQKARRSLQAELETVKMDSVDTHKISSEREFQKLQLEKHDLQRAVEEQHDRLAMASERMKKAEAHASECQIELGRIRVENSELDKRNATLEKQLKEVNVRLVDLETKAYAKKPRSSMSAVDERSSMMNDGVKELKSRRSSDIALRESSRHLQKAEEERDKAEAQIEELRKTIDKLHSEESELSLGKRRAEREAADYKAKMLSLQQEVDRLRSRLERLPKSSSRPSSSVVSSSPASSVRNPLP